MRVDFLKTVATYGIAVLVIIGGGILLVIPTQVDTDQLLPFLTGAIGTVLGYVFAERQTATTQAGNGLERRTLEAIHRRLDVELPIIRSAAGTSTDPTLTPTEGGGQE